MVPPKEIAPFAALVVMVLLPAKVTGILLAIETEFASMLFEMDTPLEDVTDSAATRIELPTAPENVTAPDPAVRVRF